jgi:MFS transporter, putative metabolite transport protein
VLAYASGLPGGGGQNLIWVFAGFAIFNLFMNLGPNATTYVMPAETSTPRSRATGSGFAAAAGEAGAAVGTLLFPLVQAAAGLSATLVVIGGGCILAAAITWTLRRASRPLRG